MDALLLQIAPIFAAEANDQAQKIASALLAMESDPSLIPGHIEELYRQAHSLKGSSSSLGIADLATLAHNLEEALTPVRRRLVMLSPQLVDVALRAMDAVRLRVEGIVADTDGGQAEVQRCIEALGRLADPISAQIDLQPQQVETQLERPGLAGSPSLSQDDGEILRVDVARLGALENRLADLRTLRGRLDHRALEAASLVQTAERIWQSTRSEISDKREEDASRDALYQLLRQLTNLRRDLLEDAEFSQISAVEVDENLRAMRMIPASLLGEFLQRAVRDACRQTNKNAQFVLTGGEVQIDRRLLEELKGPLLHLVRNAIDHGVEELEVREATGKPSRATVEVSIEQRGRDLVVEVRDDGRGIDPNAVRQKAIERGLLTNEEAFLLQEDDVQELLLRSGFSTSEKVTELSGRGVGLDVVRDAAFRLHGRIDIKSTLGRGCAVTLLVPLTVAASETMLVEESGRIFALPQSNLERIVRVRSEALQTTGGRSFFHLDDLPIPVVGLARLLGLTERVEGSGHRMLAVVRGMGERAALICERFLGTADLFMRPLPLELQSLPLINALTILPSGQAIFVLSPRALVDAAHARDERSDPHGTRGLGRPRTILVADDSITTRLLLRSSLETSGFRVRTATDGEEALRLALNEPFDLVVSDVRMPRLDGFELTGRLRANTRTSKIPIVLFSTLDSEEDHRRGAASGANIYLTKSAYDRGELLNVIQRLVRGE
jgi:two-component system chemotaxis sensor kinase CheA